MLRLWGQEIVQNSVKLHIAAACELKHNNFQYDIVINILRNNDKVLLFSLSCVLKCIMRSSILDTGFKGPL